MAIQRLEPLLSHKVFRWASGISALVALTLGVLGALIGNPSVRPVHAALAMVFLATSLLAGLAARRYGKDSHTSGLAPHGLGVFAVAVAQYALGELHQTVAHIVVGILLVIGAGALFAMSLRQPVIVTGSDAGGSPRP
ncbi:MAG: hypothetical protein ACLGHZ_01830 [Actinomycetes bacterium]